MVYVIFLSYKHTYIHTYIHIISYVKHNKSYIHKYVKTCIKSIHKCYTPHLCKRWQKRQQPAQRTVNIYHDIMRAASHWLPTMYACKYQAYMSTVLHVYYMHCMYCTYSMFCSRHLAQHELFRVNVTFSQLHVKVPLKKFRNDVFGDSLVMHFCT